MIIYFPFLVLKGINHSRTCFFSTRDASVEVGTGESVALRCVEREPRSASLAEYRKASGRGEDLLKWIIGVSTTL